MKTLITGAGGFIGSHVVQLLLRHRHEVRALVKYNGRGGVGHLGSISDPALEIRLGDVSDPYFVRDAVEGCETVMHLAALIGIPYSYVAPASYVSTNVVGTLNILEACRQAKTQRVVVTSTSEVYGTALYTPIDEYHPLQGQSPYSASKIAADKLSEAYFRSFDLPVVTLRPFNTYGPRQSARAIIPTVLTQALSGANQIELGNLAPKRDLTYVGDTARAFLMAATTPGLDGETIHFGQGTAVTIDELARICLRVAGSQAEITSVTHRSRPEKSEVGALLCDSAKARKLLGWEPEVSLEDGLEFTCDYLRQHLAEYRSKEYVV